MSRQRKTENIVYLIVWLVVFLFPVVAMFYDAVSDSDTTVHLDFSPIWNTWKVLFPFLILFLIHNIFIVPLVYKNEKKGIYASFTVLALVLFGAFQYGLEVHNYNKYVKPAMERMEEERQKMSENRQRFFEQMQERMQSDSLNPMFRPPVGVVEGQDSSQAGQMFGNRPPEGGRPPEGMRPPEGAGPEGPRMPGSRQRRDFFMWRHYDVIFKLILALMVVFANLGIALFFQTQENEKKMKELEHESMLQQLQYLRYQINPHFFMNTLNNIHALVDIDPEQAKKCILELSKLMRYVLYEGEKPTIPLEKEIEFLTQYISLMRIRYTDSVKIDIDFPKNPKGAEIPPLLFVSFVENAFKHGISYKSDSFINVSMAVVGDRLQFCCENSLNESNDDPHSGIGLENVKTRMGLLYGEDYSLKIEKCEDKYRVTSDVPLTSHMSDKLLKTT